MKNRRQKNQSNINIYLCENDDPEDCEKCNDNKEGHACSLACSPCSLFATFFSATRTLDFLLVLI